MEHIQHCQCAEGQVATPEGDKTLQEKLGDMQRINAELIGALQRAVALLQVSVNTQGESLYNASVTEAGRAALKKAGVV